MSHRNDEECTDEMARILALLSILLGVYVGLILFGFFG